MRIFKFIRKEKQAEKTVESLINELNQESDKNFYSVMISDLNTKSRYYYTCFAHVMSDNKRATAIIKKSFYGDFDNCLHIEI